MSRLDYKFKEVPFDPDLIEIMFPVAPWPEAALEKRRKLEREDYLKMKMREVRRVMNRHLTPRQKECLTLHYLRGYSQERIATRLQIHQTTVSQHIRYALKKLRRACGPK